MMAYFSNVVMIACFLGMGLGCLRRGKKSLTHYLPFVISLFLPVIVFVGSLNIGNPFDRTEYVWGTGRNLGFIWVVPAVFLSITFIFTSIGQILGKYLDQLTPTKAYLINLVGSLAGIFVMTFLSFLNTAPWIWFSLAGLMIIWNIRHKPLFAGLGAICLTVSLMVVSKQQKYCFWSPYYKIEAASLPSFTNDSFSLTVNHDYHQMALNLQRPWSGHEKEFYDWKSVYDLPFQFNESKPKDVLILGAGTGNDVAAALRSGAGHVTAVELDPVILKIGQRHHPEHPYADSRVKIVNNDARFFLRTSKASYDLIVMGWLDSHRIFSSLTNIRQDNFLYTLECLKKIHLLLKPKGLLILSFNTGKPWIDSKIYSLIRENFGSPPHVYSYPNGAYGKEGHIFVASQNPSVHFPPLAKGFVEITDQIFPALAKDVPSDDWPFLYYQGRFLSLEYSSMLIALTAITFLLVHLQLRGTNFIGSQLLFFGLLGIGFMLLETRNITSFALLYGSTWLVTSIVICSVIVIISAACFLAEKNCLPSENTCWIFLFITLTLSYFIREIFLPGSPMVRGICMSVLLSSSFFFSGSLFIMNFAKTTSPRMALGANTLGAVIGGFLEYGCLIVGLRNLLIIAGLIYFMAWLLWRKRNLAIRDKSFQKIRLSFPWLHPFK